jgi:hypothetical protein
VLNQHAAFDPHLDRFHQIYCDRLALPCQESPAEYPRTLSCRSPIAVPHPVSRFPPMTASRPPPQGSVNLMIDQGFDSVSVSEGRQAMLWRSHLTDSIVTRGKGMTSSGRCLFSR